MRMFSRIKSDYAADVPVARSISFNEETQQTKPQKKQDTVNREKSDPASGR